MPPVRSDRHLAFGEAIRELRNERGISQEALALECDLDRTYVGGIERGELNPSLTNVFKIADALQVGAAEIHARADAILAASRR